MRFDYYYEKGRKWFFFFYGTLQNKIKNPKFFFFLTCQTYSFVAILLCAFPLNVIQIIDSNSQNKFHSTLVMIEWEVILYWLEWVIIRIWFNKISLEQLIMPFCTTSCPPCFAHLKQIPLVLRFIWKQKMYKREREIRYYFILLLLLENNLI